MQQAVRDPLIGFMAATAQAQAEATKAAQRADIEHAKQHGAGLTLDASQPSRAQLDQVRNCSDTEPRGSRGSPRRPA
jgi:putative DNA-invertase from lambdoid prophage Rac